MPVYSIEGGMAEALGHLKCIAQHFADHDQADTANELGKLSLDIVHAFSEGIDRTPTAQYQKDPEPDLNKAIEAKPASNNTVHKQAVAALMKEVNHEIARGQGLTNAVMTRTPCHDGQRQAGHIHPHMYQYGPVHEKQLVQAGTIGPGNMLQRVPVHQGGRLVQAGATHGAMTALQRMPMANDESHHPGSWAQVAVSKYPTGVQNGGHYTPYPNANYGPRDPSSDGEGSSPRMTGVSLAPEIPTEPKAGVIRIHGKVTRDAIQFITTRIHEGPLLEIQIENKACVRVSFQHATQAQAFLKSNQEMEQMAGFGRFGVGYHIELAEVVDWNEDHRRMNQPVRERRRLSFARKRLFADNMTPEKWRQDVKNVAGVANIDFLWVFNSGNATAVFTSTFVARQVLDMFNKWKAGDNEYSDVAVSFSSDPCEKELVLSKDAGRGRNMTRRMIR